MTSDIAWEWYRSFLEVTRTGSLSAAARSLGITQPTVGRHIAALEAQLALRLFVRTASGLQPTQQALALRPYAESMAHTAAALQRAAHGQRQEVVGSVRISASEVLAVEVLPMLLSPLLHQHPGLELEIVASDQMQDLLRRDCDVAVRMLRPTQTQLIAQHLGQVELGLYAHVQYLQRQGTPATMPALLEQAHTLIGFDVATPFVRRLLQPWPGLQRSSFHVRTDSASCSLALLRAGAGLGVCHTGIAQRDAALVRVLASQFSVRLDVWLAMHEDLRHQPACQMVFQALARGLKDHLADATTVPLGADSH